MPSKAHVRSLFPMPLWELLSEDDRGLLVRIDQTGEAMAAAAARIPAAGLDLELRAPGGWFVELAHELSPMFPARMQGFERCQRAAAEWAILSSHHGALRATLDGNDSAAFIDGVVSIARSVAGVEGLRRHCIGTVPDENGHYVMYPPDDLVEDRLNCLFAALKGRTTEPRSFQAVLALVWLTHCHPFVDGNGRTARIMFNMLLQRNVSCPSYYIPLYELAALSRRGYILRVREAELYRRWSPLFRFIKTAVSLWSAILEDETAESPHEAKLVN